MSCAWGFHCEECGEHTDTAFNHGEARLTELVKNLDLIKSVNGLTYLCIDWESHQYLFAEFLEFAEKHRGHKTFKMVNEYGEFAWFDD
jgi:hypothetical protein